MGDKGSGFAVGQGDGLRIGVAGLGVMGRQHLRLLAGLNGVRLVVVCDRSQEACADATERLDDVQAVEDWRLLPEFRLDAVVNALPTGLHFETTSYFLKQGIHTLVEKPLAGTLAEAKELMSQAREGGVRLMVGHVERFNPAVQILKSIIDSGRLGDIVTMSARRVGVARPAVPTSNVAVDLATHDLDIFAYLSGKRGRLLFATGATMESNTLEDHVDLILEFGETIASSQANWITPAKIRHLSVTGIRGLAEVDYIDQSVQIFDSVPDLIKGAPWNFFAVSRESSPTHVPVRRNEPLRLELQHFVDCVAHGLTPLTDAAQTIPALELALEATSLIRRNKIAKA